VFSDKISSFFFVATLLLLGVSILVHSLLFAGFNTRDQFPLLWNFLQYAIVVGFIPPVTNWLHRQGITEPPQTSDSGLPGYERSVSGWVVVFILATMILLAYAFFSYMYWYVEKLHQWSPYISDGEYFAYYKMVGNKIRSLTAEEYRVMSFYYARAFSSHWPLFHLIAVALLIQNPAEQIVGRERRKRVS
jgi:hypothetical protein